MFGNVDKITALERSDAILKYSDLKQAIVVGSWQYSQSKLKSDFDAFRLVTWVQLHNWWTLLIFLICFLLGAIPGVVFVVVLAFSKAGRENYELHIQKLKNGALK